MFEAADDLSWDLLPVESFAEFAGDWDALNDAGSASPALTSTILLIALRTLGAGNEQLAIAKSANRIVAMTVLCRPSRLRVRSFQPAQLPVGAWVQSSDVPFPFVLRSLMRALPLPILSVEITQQDPGILRRPEVKGGVPLWTSDYIETSGVDTTGSFEAYWDQRGSNLRQNLRKLHNRLVRERLRGEVRFFTDCTAVGDAVDRYGELESRGWKGSEGTALHPSNTQGKFYRDLLCRYAAEGAALVAEYWIGNDLVCSDLCIARRGVLIILKTAHSERQGRFSPATLLNYELFQYLFASSAFKRVEFYGRVMDWHRRYMTDSRRMYHVSAYRTSCVHRVASGTRGLRAALRTFLEK